MFDQSEIDIAWWKMQYGQSTGHIQTAATKIDISKLSHILKTFFYPIYFHFLFRNVKLSFILNFTNALC